MKKSGSLFKTILLITGTSIGGGMLALPVVTGLAGFFPSILLYLVCWLFMATTGLLLLEVCCWMEAESNLITMAERTLGFAGKVAAWFLYIFLFYCLTVAYIEGCGDLIAEVFHNLIPHWAASLLFTLLVAPLLYFGAAIIGRLNVILMLGLAITYCAFVVLGFSHVRVDLLMHRNWSYSVLALPIAFTAFSYQGIIPTLLTYMNRDIPRLRLAIWIGSFLPFIVYTIWQGLILGIVPTYGPGGLVETLHQGYNAVYPLKHFLNSPSIYLIGQFFAFFALITSFLGVTLGLIDFLADGLSIKKTPLGKLYLCLLVLVPPLLISITYPGIFLMALDFAGGFGCALLLGLLPALMVWSGRYYLNYKGPYAVPGGKGLLGLVVGFIIFELIVQFYIIINKFL